jgi:CRP/FNR family transcriptional regulator
MRTSRPARVPIPGAVTAYRPEAPPVPEPRRQRSVVLPIGGRVSVACPSCNVRRVCIAEGQDMDMARQFDLLVVARISLRKGDTLFRDGESFTALYAIRLGSCKTVLHSDGGHEQVAGFHMSGDVLGLGGIVAHVHDSQAVALEDTQVCVLPFERIEEFARGNTGFQHALHRLLSREIGRERDMTMLLGSMRAEQRLATFLLDLSRRYEARGYSPSEFILRLTREELGSYLGLQLETVSRLFSRFHAEGVLHVSGRVVKVIDRLALRALLEVGIA